MPQYIPVTVERDASYTGPTNEAGQPTGSTSTNTVYDGQARIFPEDLRVRRGRQGIDKVADYTLTLSDEMLRRMRQFEEGDTVTWSANGSVPAATGTIFKVDLVNGFIYVSET